jgi:hypothetical protein
MVIFYIVARFPLSADPSGREVLMPFIALTCSRLLAWRVKPLWAVAALLCALIAASPGADPTAAPKPVAGGKSVTEDAMVLAREAPGKPWRAVAKNGEVRTEEAILGLPGGALATNSGAVRLNLLGDLDRISPFPVYEAVAVLHENPNFDLDFTLERGRVSVANTKEKGSAKVRIRFHDQAWEATLVEPGAKVALELFGRWPSGARFKKKPGPTDVPHANLNLVVVEGTVLLKHHDGLEHRMQAPKGPAFIEWDNSTGGSTAPLKLDAVPPWVSEETTTELGKQKLAGIEAFRKMIVAKSLEQAIEEVLRSDDKLRQRGGIVLLGATDNLIRLGEVLGKSNDPELWNQAVITVRHWLGRGPGQDQKLYQVLQEHFQFKPVHAETMLQLLHSFDDNALKRPETYEMLITYLDHEKLGIRGLAYWHLRRLVPAGEKFGFNPLDPPETREKAVAEWKKLIPAGEVPKAVKPEGK